MKSVLKSLVLAVLGVCLTAGVFAQSEPPRDGVFTKKNVVEGEVTTYAPLREADVMWAKRVWRIIDIREKINLPFNYPKSRLIDVMMDAVLAGELTAYNPDSDDEFKVPMTPEEVGSIGRTTETTEVQDPTTGEFISETVTNDFNREEVIKYRVKEDWFFDRQRSVFECRIIGIAPVYNLRNSEGVFIGEKALFWVYFDEARNIFVNNEVFNRFNDAARMSYDDLFIKRMFNSYIIKQSNVYDRRIEDYKTGLDALYEAQALEKELFEFEHDLWEY